VTKSIRNSAVPIPAKRLLGLSSRMVASESESFLFIAARLEERIPTTHPAADAKTVLGNDLDL
jgi:hypothetical protein